jgi:hypothetical protein
MSSTFNGTLDVTIADIQSTQSQSLSKQDPYCVLTLGSSGPKSLMEGSAWGKDTFKTKVHSGAGQHPVFNESHTFNLKNMKLDSLLKVKLYDKDVIKDDYLAVATITLEQLLLHDKQGVQYYPMCKKTTMGTSSQGQIGQVGIAVTFNCTEIPQRQGDTKSQVRDIATRKDQQWSGVGESQQQASKPFMEGQQGQMQQGLPQQSQGTQLQGTQLQGQQGYQSTFPQQQGTMPQQQYTQQ